MRVTMLDHLVLTVSDIGQSCEFYTRALGMRADTFTAQDGSSRHALYFGDQKINLHLAGQAFKPHARQATAGSADLCFLVSEPIDGVIAHLAALGIAIELGPVSRSGATGQLDSVYVRDPDGNLIELSRYHIA